MSVALLSLADPRCRERLDGDDMNALHKVDGAGGRFAIAFTHPDPEAFIDAVASDLSGYLRARHGWTGPVLEAPTLVSLVDAGEVIAALLGLAARAMRLAPPGAYEVVLG